MDNPSFETEFETVDSARVVVEDGKKLIVNHVDTEWRYEDDPGNGEDEAETGEDVGLSLTIDSPELEWHKLLLLGTLQKIPKRLANGKYRYVLRLAQLFLLLAAVAHYLYVLGVFGDKTLVEEELDLTLTTFKNIFWNSRNPIFTLLGFWYFRKEHLDNMLRSLRLRSSYLRRVIFKIKVCFVLELAFTVLLPACLNLVQMLYLRTAKEKNKTFSLQIAILNAVLLVLGRLLAFPIVAMFIAEFYLIYYHVRQYKKKIQAWNIMRKNEARNDLIDIKKTLIEASEKAWQPYLIISIGILILIVFPGIFCYVERFRSEGTYTKTYYTQPSDRMSDPLYVLDTGDMKGLKKSLDDLENHLTNLTQNHDPVFLRIKNNKKKHKSEKHVAEKHKDKIEDSKAQERIVFEAITFLGELLALFLPIILLGKINEVLKRIPETIRSLKFDEQEGRNYLFQNPEGVKEMLKPDFEHIKGFQILGMELTVVKASLIALLAPLLTLLIHIMLRHVDLEP